MTSRLLELAVRRGALQERIAMQRRALSQHAAPLAAALSVGDTVIDGVGWLKRHPVVVLAATAAIVLAKPRGALRWARRGLIAWRGWKAVRMTLSRVV